MIVPVSVTPDMIALAKELSNDMGRLKNSIMSGEGNFVGFIGELALSRFSEYELANTYDYDLVIQSIPIDVKTKKCSHEPLPSYECSVASYNTSQQCLAYFFARYSEEYNVVWLLGWLGKDEFYEKSKFLKRGQLDRSNNYRVRSDCYNIRISELRSFEFMRKRDDTIHSNKS